MIASSSPYSTKGELIQGLFRASAETIHSGTGCRFCWPGFGGWHKKAAEIVQFAFAPLSPFTFSSFSSHPMQINGGSCHGCAVRLRFVVLRLVSLCGCASAVFPSLCPCFVVRLGAPFVLPLLSSFPFVSFSVWCDWVRQLSRVRRSWVRTIQATDFRCPYSCMVCTNWMPPFCMV